MPLEVPNLDDRRWTDLVDEARSLIPRNSPRWTDHNVHDPGITFIELFAWLAEMQIYQLNRVGRQHREAFAQLAGVPRTKRKPAHVDIRVEGDVKESTFLPAGTQLTPIEGQELVFETDSDLFLTRSRLQKVIADDGSGQIDHSQANEKPGIAFLAFGENAKEGAELRLGFDTFYPREPKLSLTAHVFTDDLVERCSTERPLSLTEDAEDTPRVDLVWEYLGSGEKWLPLNDIKDRTNAFAHSGAITFSVPTDAVSKNDRVWIRARIRRGYYDIEPRLRSISLNVLPCSQKETVKNEFLEPVTGKPDQSFTLDKKPVLVPEPSPRTSITSSDVADWDHLAEQLKASKPELANRLRSSLATPDKNNFSAYQRIKDLNLELASSNNLQQATESNLQTGGKDDDLSHLLGRTPVVISVDNEIWHPIPSFKDSGPDSKHYIFDADTGLIEFGNGLNGQIPMAGQQVRAVWYQASSGRSGNVAKDLKWKFRGGGIAGVNLTNPEPATGGADPETLDQLELRVRAELNRPQRAVTLRDLELLALSTPHAYVARAQAIPNCPAPESITVVALPKVRPGRKGAPNPPSPVFLNMIQRNLQRRRLLCDNLRVVPPVYVELKVSARLRLSKGAGEEAVVKRARDAVDSFLVGELQPSDQAPATKQDSVRRESTQSPCFTRWPFGRWVFPSEVYAILDGVTGIDFASNLVLTASRSGVAVQANQTGAIPIPRTGLVFPGEHNFSVEFDIRRNG